MSHSREFREAASKVPLDKDSIDDILKAQSLATIDYFHRQRDENDPLQYKVWHQMFHSHSNPNLKHNYNTFKKSREDKGLPMPYQEPSTANDEPAGKRKSSKPKVDPRMCGKDAYDRKALLPYEYARANIDGTCVPFVQRKRQILDASNRRTQRLAKRLDALDERLKIYVEASRQGSISNPKTTKFHWHSEKNLRQMRNGLF